jgi:hypothetical protein
MVWKTGSAGDKYWEWTLEDVADEQRKQEYYAFRDALQHRGFHIDQRIIDHARAALAAQVQPEDYLALRNAAPDLERRVIAIVREDKEAKAWKAIDDWNVQTANARKAQQKPTLSWWHRVLLAAKIVRMK